jgi:hypothetical protein
MSSPYDSGNSFGEPIPVTLETAIAKLPARLRETTDAVFYYPWVVLNKDRILTRGGKDPVGVKRTSWAFFDDPDWAALPGHPSKLYLVDTEIESVTEHDCDTGPLVLADKDEKSGTWKPVNTPKETRPRSKKKEPIPVKDLYDTDHFVPAADCPLPKAQEKGGGAENRNCKKYAIILKGSAKTPEYEGEDWPVDQDMMDNATRMTDALTAKGYKVIDTARIKDDIPEDTPVPRPFQKACLEKIITELAKTVKCCDQVIFYYTGHGAKTGYVPGAEPNAGDHIDHTGFSICAETGMNATDLAKLMAKLKVCHLNVIMDCCYAGGLLKALSHLPGLEAACASSQWDETSYGSGVDPSHPAGPGSEFSAGFISGVEKAPAGSSAPELLDDGFQESAKTDVTAKAGAAAGPNARGKRMTHPISLRRKKKCKCNNRGPEFTDEDACVKKP